MTIMGMAIKEAEEEKAEVISDLESEFEKYEGKVTDPVDSVRLAVHKRNMREGVETIFKALIGAAEILDKYGVK